MNPSPDSGIDIHPMWAAAVAIGAILIAWAKRMNPRPLFVAFAEYSFGPVVEKRVAPMCAKLDEHGVKIDRICSAFDELPGADKAKSDAKAKRDGWGE